MKISFALMACALLLSGCVLLPAPQDGKAPFPTPPAPPSPPIGENDEQANQIDAGEIIDDPAQTDDFVPEVEQGNWQNDMGESEGETIVENEDPPDPFTGWIPRSMSDNIGDGRFFLLDQNLSPLKVYVINNGHADSILVNKGEFNMLVDAGNFERTAAFLEAKKIKKLDVLVASRDTPDAIEGMLRLFDSYEIGEFWENGVPPSSNEYREIVEKVGDRKITVKRPQSGDFVDLWGARVDVLNPQKQRMYGTPENDAIVLKLSFSGFCMLLLNPTVQEREVALMNSQENLKCEVITYYGHGEGRPTPSILVSRSDPKDVIISVGPNTNGLPSGTTITRLTMDGRNVFRTDADGTILVEKRITKEYRVAPNQ